MILKSMIAVIGAVASASLFGGVKSAPAIVSRDAGGSLLYRTLTGPSVTLKWVMPEKASSATLSVTGDGGYSAVYADLTTTQQALELPAAPSRPDNEQIFTLTLEFDSGERYVARLGSVCGVGNGSVAPACTCRVAGTRPWERTSFAEVVPVVAGMTDFTVALDAGTPTACDPGLDGEAGWMRLPVGDNGVYTLAALQNGAAVDATFTYIASGLLLIFR